MSVTELSRFANSAALFFLFQSKHPEAVKAMERESFKVGTYVQMAYSPKFPRQCLDDLTAECDPNHWHYSVLLEILEEIRDKWGYVTLANNC